MVSKVSCPEQCWRTEVKGSASGIHTTEVARPVCPCDVTARAPPLSKRVDLEHTIRATHPPQSVPFISLINPFFDLLVFVKNTQTGNVAKSLESRKELPFPEKNKT